MLPPSHPPTPTSLMICPAPVQAELEQKDQLVAKLESSVKELKEKHQNRGSEIKGLMSKLDGVVADVSSPAKPQVDVHGRPVEEADNVKLTNKVCKNS